MFNLNKIRGHIKMLDFEKLKLTRYADEATRQTPRNPKREADIARALRRVEAGIDMWTKKLEAIDKASQKPQVETRNTPLHHGPNDPLIG